MAPFRIAIGCVFTTYDLGRNIILRYNPILVMVMSLVPCKVCGTLNSEDTEICLSCEFPIKGRGNKDWYKWVALALALMFGLPFTLHAIQTMMHSVQTQPSSSKTK
jgi:hypothetical protein